MYYRRARSLSGLAKGHHGTWPSLLIERPHGLLPLENRNPTFSRRRGSDLLHLVGVAGFEPAASSSRTKRAAKLRYTPPTAYGV